jgi:hypothetical protein
MPTARLASTFCRLRFSAAPSPFLLRLPIASAFASPPPLTWPPSPPPLAWPPSPPLAPGLHFFVDSAHDSFTCRNGPPASFPVRPGPRSRFWMPETPSPLPARDMPASDRTAQPRLKKPGQCQSRTHAALELPWHWPGTRRSSGTPCHPARLGCPCRPGTAPELPRH